MNYCVTRRESNAAPKRARTVYFCTVHLMYAPNATRMMFWGFGVWCFGVLLQRTLPSSGRSCSHVHTFTHHVFTLVCLANWYLAHDVVTRTALFQIYRVLCCSYRYMDPKPIVVHFMINLKGCTGVRWNLNARGTYPKSAMAQIGL